ncbi:MAG: Silver exporting P-type ATPase [candidate division WS6 bacterium OLB20]|uniref:Silver exporting P-type ATPase n=1 Tax=candidate division WS6 bacterium OLB20 TaxID=1617426 RepID=A0A136LYV8_9BACT|nr:MAG: Silver exporting P-type ATPase [candidate division WS6 bacterium OLB20]
MNKIIFKAFLPAATLAAIIIHLLLHLTGNANAALIILQAAVTLGLVPLVIDTAKMLLQKRFGVDYIALAGILGSLLLGEVLAGAIIVLMLSGGELLEEFALKRSRNELNRLLSLVPTRAHIRSGETITDVPVDRVKAGDELVIRPGEVVPVDGTVTEGQSEVDQSSITGESLPVQKRAGMQVMSGSVVSGSPLVIRADRTASESKYQLIVELVKEAEENRAPFVRLADRYSVGFTAVAFTLAAAAWVLSGDPVRALSVLVVATPCPLILATPIAFASGISKAAGKGVVFKSGEAMEHLARATAVIFDKTGTLTMGVPAVTEVVLLDSKDKAEVLRIAASAEQLSQHVVARSLVRYAQKHGAELSYPEDFFGGVWTGCTLQSRRKHVCSWKTVSV